jgi:hypothetical protein
MELQARQSPCSLSAKTGGQLEALPNKALNAMVGRGRPPAL